MSRAVGLGSGTVEFALVKTTLPGVRLWSGLVNVLYCPEIGFVFSNINKKGKENNALKNLVLKGCFLFCFFFCLVKGSFLNFLKTIPSVLRFYR